MITDVEGNIVPIERLKECPSYWYLANPYSRYRDGIEVSFEMISAIAAELVCDGVPVFSPISHSHPIAVHGGVDPLDHTIWMPLDEPMMKAAHGLIVAKMHGWEESYGVGVEIREFRAAGKPILFMEVDDE